MKIVTPAFGLISGVVTALGLFPHVLSLCILLIMKIPPKSVASLFAFTIAAKLLVEWFFWGYFKRRMDAERRLKNWRSVINQSILSHPNSYTALLMIFADSMIDLTLVQKALQTSTSSILVFLCLLGSQLIASPIQGLLSDYFSQKKSILFAAFIGMLCMIFPLEQEKKDPIFTFLSSISVLNLTIITLCIKGLLGNITVIARASIAELIKVEVLKKNKSI